MPLHRQWPGFELIVSDLALVAVERDRVERRRRRIQNAVVEAVAELGGLARRAVSTAPPRPSRRERGHAALRVVDVALDLDERDRRAARSAVAVADRVAASPSSPG